MTIKSIDRKLATISGDGSICRIGLSVDLPASAEVVWQALTQVDVLSDWWPDWRYSSAASTVGKPSSSQRVMPPATGNTLEMPCFFKNSATRALDASLGHVHTSATSW